MLTRLLHRVTSHDWKDELEQSPSQSRRSFVRGTLLVLAVAIASNWIVLISTKPAVGVDALLCMGIARNLAAGRGYVVATLWRDTRTMERAPVWPALLSASAWLASGADDTTSVRVTAACLNAANAVLLFRSEEHTSELQSLRH